MTPGFNGTKKVVDIPANGTLQNILADGPVRYFEMKESNVKADGSANAPLQGFQYKLQDDNFTQLLAPDLGETVKIGDRQGRYGVFGVIQGQVAQPIVGDNTVATVRNLDGTYTTTGRAATTLAKVQSSSATATSLEITFYY